MASNTAEERDGSSPIQSTQVASATKPVDLRMKKENNTNYEPGPPNRWFLEAFKYPKTTRNHLLGGPGIESHDYPRSQTL